MNADVEVGEAEPVMVGEECVRAVVGRVDLRDERAERVLLPAGRGRTEEGDVGEPFGEDSIVRNLGGDDQH